MNVLFVCDGNIARSPMAEALLRKMLMERGVVGATVASCGLSARHWGIADRRQSLVIGDTYKVLENHHSRPLTEEAVQESDLIFGMENRHVIVILERFPEAKGKVDVITAYAGREGEVKDYPANEQLDPISWMRQCYSLLLPCLETVADRLAR